MYIITVFFVDLDLFYANEIYLNKHTCKDVFSANISGNFEGCVNEWIRFSWSKYKDDDSADCIYCKKFSTYFWDLPLNVLCNFSTKNVEVRLMFRYLFEISARK